MMPTAHIYASCMGVGTIIVLKAIVLIRVVHSRNVPVISVVYCLRTPRCVSYVALGTGLKHVLDGMVAHWAHARRQVLKGIAGVLGGNTAQAAHLPKSPSSSNSTMALMGRGDGGGGGGFIQSTMDDDMGGDIGAGTGELADQTQSPGGMNEGPISTSRTPNEPTLRDAAQLAELEDDNDIANGFADSDITDLTGDESSVASDIGRESSRPESGLRPGAQQSTGLGRRQSVQDVLAEGARALVKGAEAAAELEGVGGLSDDEDVEEARALEPHANWGEEAGRQGTVGDLEEARAASTARPGSTPSRHELMTEVLSDRGVAGTCFGRTMRSRAYVYYALCFTGVTMVSLANPNGFVLMLELVESLAMNIGTHPGTWPPPTATTHDKLQVAHMFSGECFLSTSSIFFRLHPRSPPSASSLVCGYHVLLAVPTESGLFIAIMYYGAVHDSKAKPSDLVLPLSHGFSKALLYFSASTFSTAIVYDLYHSMDVVGGDEFAGLFFFMMVFVCLETLLLFTVRYRTRTTTPPPPSLPFPHPFPAPTPVPCAVASRPTGMCPPYTSHLRHALTPPGRPPPHRPLPGLLAHIDVIEYHADIVTANRSTPLPRICRSLGQHAPPPGCLGHCPAPPLSRRLVVVR